MAKTTVDTLANDVMKILDDYGADVTKLSVEVVKKVGPKGVQALKSGSGVFKGTGKYASGWRSQVEQNRFGAKATLHNARLPGLPHLLENGHAKRGGGRVHGTVHIEPVERELDRVFTQDLEAALK